MAIRTSTFAKKVRQKVTRAKRQHNTHIEVCNLLPLTLKPAAIVVLQRDVRGPQAVLKFAAQLCHPLYLRTCRDYCHLLKV